MQHKNEKVVKDRLRKLTDKQLKLILENHKLWLKSGRKKGEQANLSRTSLVNRNLSFANLQEAVLSGSDLTDANLRSANLEKALLRKTLLVRTNLNFANLRGAVLTSADLEKASCLRTIFEEALINKAKFNGAELHSTNFINVFTGEQSIEDLLENAEKYDPILTEDDYIMDVMDKQLDPPDFYITKDSDSHIVDPLTEQEESLETAQSEDIIIIDKDWGNSSNTYSKDISDTDKNISQLELLGKEFDLILKESELNIREQTLDLKQDRLAKTEGRLKSKEIEINEKESLLELTSLNTVQDRLNEINVDELTDKETPFIGQEWLNCGKQDPGQANKQLSKQANQEEDVVDDETIKIASIPVFGKSSFMPKLRFNTRFLLAIGLVIAFSISFIFTMTTFSIDSESSVKANTNNKLAANGIEINTATNGEQESSDELIPYKVEVDPNNIEENPTVILGIGNVTTLDLEEKPKEIILGDKEVVEISKSPSNPKRLYLIGKSATTGSNLVIETISGKTLTIFFKIVEHASLGDFNGEVKISTKVKEIS